jgi:hypothetical protein
VDVSFVESPLSAVHRPKWLHMFITHASCKLEVMYAALEIIYHRLETLTTWVGSLIFRMYLGPYANDHDRKQTSRVEVADFSYDHDR